MAPRSRSGSAEGSGDEIRPHGEDHDSSEESEDDPEEAKRIAEGFIVDGDDDEEDEDEDGEGEGDIARMRKKKNESKEERRRRKREEKRKRREAREARKHEPAELSDDELDLLNENQGIGGPSHRPAKRARQDVDEDGLPRLQDMFADDEARLGEDDDDDDLGDFIEESEEEGDGEDGGETEEQRRERKRQEKLQRRAAKKAKPDAAGVDKVYVGISIKLMIAADGISSAWDEIHDVFGDGTDFDWALEAQAETADADYEDETRKNLRLEDVSLRVTAVTMSVADPDVGVRPSRDQGASPPGRRPNPRPTRPTRATPACQLHPFRQSSHRTRQRLSRPRHCRPVCLHEDIDPHTIPILWYASGLQLPACYTQLPIPRSSSPSSRPSHRVHQCCDSSTSYDVCRSSRSAIPMAL